MNLKSEIEKTEKEIRNTNSEYRKRDLIKYLLKLKRKEKYAEQNNRTKSKD